MYHIIKIKLFLQVYSTNDVTKGQQKLKKEPETKCKAGCC